jgi:hypothetical protein
VPEVVRTLSGEGFSLGLSERRLSGLVEDDQVGRAGDDATARRAEDAPAGAGAELGKVGQPADGTSSA